MSQTESWGEWGERRQGPDRTMGGVGERRQGPDLVFES